MDEEKRTALIVDDEEIMLDIESFMLQKIGFNILKAGNSAEACQLYKDKKEHIDIVVLDMIMPDENGANTYKRLKKMNPDIRVLVSSGLERDGSIDEILNDGQNGFIRKPFQFEEFTNNIDAMLS
jgi:two-component system cell cycle sensor histidine kinase/response regulator CckA